MDDTRSIPGDGEAVPVAEETLGVEAPPAIGNDERRMHVRAYNYWVSLLDGRPFPSISDLDPSSLADFGPHSVLLDFAEDVEDPAVRFLGTALAGECAVGQEITRISDVPPRSLLSRLTDHHLQIIANRAPIGFEAEFVSQRGHNTLYRGILMPFSSDGEGIDFIYGVINWKELADADTTATLMLQVDRALRAASPTGSAAPLWADGPSRSGSSFAGSSAVTSAGAELPEGGLDFAETDPADEGEEPGTLVVPAPADELADVLAAAREGAAAASHAHGRSRAALYRALSLAYDFALIADARPDDYAELLADAGVVAQARAPMTAVAKLVFGVDADKARLTEFAAALSHGIRNHVAPGSFGSFLDRFEGGLKGVVAAERRNRRPAGTRDLMDRARDALRTVEPRAVIDFPSDGGEFVLLLARREGRSRLALVAPVPEDKSLIDRAIRRLAR